PGEPGGGGNPRDVHAIRAGGGGVLHGGLYVRTPGERVELPDSDAGLEQKPRERLQELERRRADCGLDVLAHCQARVRSGIRKATVMGAPGGLRWADVYGK